MFVSVSVEKDTLLSVYVGIIQKQLEYSNGKLHMDVQFAIRHIKQCNPSMAHTQLRHAVIKAFSD